jgi:hypothetical protein
MSKKASNKAPKRSPRKTATPAQTPAPATPPPPPQPAPALLRVVASATASLSRNRRIVAERLENGITNITITNSDSKVIAFGLSDEAAFGLLATLSVTVPSHA